MDTTNGFRSCGESSFGKGKEISKHQRRYCLSKSYIVVMAGRWIMYDNGAWDFKIDNDRMGRTVDCSKIKGVDGLKEIQITTDTDYKIFKALHRADKSVNVFVTFREFVRGGMIFLRSERVIMSQINACDGAPDNDEALLQHVEAIE
ncbi:unnamed protein product, partial [Brassica oleracea var. botrytis]